MSKVQSTYCTFTTSSITANITLAGPKAMMLASAWKDIGKVMARDSSKLLFLQESKFALSEFGKVKTGTSKGS